MTLQNGLIDGQSAYLWADTAYFDESSGELLGFDSKLFVGEFWPFAGALSGRSRTLSLLDIPNAIASAMPSTVESLLHVATAAVRDFSKRDKGALLRLLLATWEARPQLFMISTDDCAGRALEPVEVGGYLAWGADHPMIADMWAKGVTVKSMSDVIDIQIAQPFTLFDNEELGSRPWVGGEIMQVEVSRTGVRSKSLRAI